MTSTRNNASQNGAQAGPVQFAWNSIHPPLEPFAAGLEAVAPSMPPLPPLSRSSSRTSSSTLHSFPATPCLPGNMLPHVSTVNYAEQGHFQASNGGYSTSPLHMPGSGMVCHPEVVATSALGHQPSQMYNPAGAFSVSQSHLSQERNFTGAGFVPPQFYSLHESTSTSCYYAPTQPIYNPQQYPTAATSGGIEVPTATNLPELPGSFQFTFIAQPQLQMPDSSYVGPVPDEHHFHPSLNELSQFHSGPLPVLGTDSHHSMPTFVNNDPNDNLDPTVQQEQSTTPTTGLVMGSTITECPTLNALVDGSSTVDDSWIDDILAEWASMSPPDSGLQTQTAGLPDVAPTAAPASAPVARRKRTKDESEGGAIEAAETSQPTDQKKRKKKSYKPLTSRRSGVSREEIKHGYSCPDCRNRVTPGREEKHRTTRGHVAALNPKAAKLPGAYECKVCRNHFSRLDACVRHLSNVHHIKDPPEPMFKFYPKREEAFLEAANSGVKPSLLAPA